jgi:hypothetical protein
VTRLVIRSALSCVNGGSQSFAAFWISSSVRLYSSIAAGLYSGQKVFYGQ